MFRSWLQRLPARWFATVQRLSPRSRKQAAFRPALHSLEDRAVPSVSSTLPQDHAPAAIQVGELDHGFHNDHHHHPGGNGFPGSGQGPFGHPGSGQGPYWPHWPPYHSAPSGM
jgi:hypothetical protein